MDVMYEATACGTRTYIDFPNIETCTAVNTVMHIVACTPLLMLAMWPPHVAQSVCMIWGNALCESSYGYLFSYDQIPHVMSFGITY